MLVRAMFAAVALGACLLSNTVVEAQATVLDWNDGPVTLTSSFQTMTGISTSAAPRAIYGKVIVTNTSTGTRDVECKLEMPSVSVDFAQVRLAAGASATVALQIAVDPVNTSTAGLTCRVSSSSTSGVQATWAKTTTMTVSSVTANRDG